MKYVATCPACEARLPRSWAWSSAAALESCPHCAAPIRRAGRGLHGGFLLFGFAQFLMIVIGFVVGLFTVGPCPGSIAGSLAGVGASFAISAIVFPFCSTYEPAYPGCAACGYNLTGNTSGVCPECGTNVDEERC